LTAGASLARWRAEHLGTDVGKAEVQLMSDEPRVTPPGGIPSDQPDEATVALPASPGGDEPTAVMHPGAPADDPTVTIQPDPPADEPTVTPDDEPTAAPDDESTVVTPPARADEPTAVTPPDAPDDEATVAMHPGAAEDEATTVLTPAAAPDETTADPDEATEQLAPADDSDELTVALSATKLPAEELTVALPADELTVAIPAAEVPDEQTVTLAASAVAPEEATTLLPPAPTVAAAAPTEPRGTFLTRRRLLLGLSGVAGTALVATAVAVHSATNDPAEDAAKPAPSSPAVTKPRTPESATVTTAPIAIPVQRRPISTLAEYTKAAGKSPFPSDAVALTIDDGPHPIWTPKILKLLDKYQVPAMFCMIGNQVLGHEDVAQMVTTAGHQLANHTWSHPTKLGKKPTALMQKEIHRAQTKIQRTTGYEPKLFRSPGGDWSPQLLRDVAQAGLLPLDWSNDPRDWTQPGAPTIEHRMLAAKPGQILLCHDGGGDRSQTYQALSAVIPALKSRGLHFVAL
jgi:peptidoglycan/xylan/chitin deacetylase (PgdA/CDA1 family)